MWTEIVSEKIRNQQRFLEDLGKKENVMLAEYIKEIQPGDTTNREGHAANVYFNAVFGMDFSRSLDIPINAALNYGYGIILSTFNREIVSNGYITQLGLFHDNMFNQFNLGSDLMEPFRILVDRKVYEMKPEKLEKEEKLFLAIEETRRRFGKRAIYPAALMKDLKMPEYRDHGLIMPYSLT